MLVRLEIDALSSLIRAVSECVTSRHPSSHDLTTQLLDTLGEVRDDLNSWWWWLLAERMLKHRLQTALHS